METVVLNMLHMRLKSIMVFDFAVNEELAEKVYVSRQFLIGKREFPIVKDTTPNMMNPRLYTTSYNKPQGQQFDTAVLSFL